MTNPWTISIAINAQTQAGLREAVAALAPLALSNTVSIPAPVTVAAPSYTHETAGAPALSVAQVAALAGEEVASVVAAVPAVAAAVRERGKPAPGRARRTKAEIEEDEAAERAEREAAERVEQAEVAGQEADPKDVAIVEGIGSKVAEEAEQVDEAPAEPTFWWDGEDEVVFELDPGVTPPEGERYEQLTKAQYERALARGTQQGAPAFAKAILAQATAEAAKPAPAAGDVPTVEWLFDAVEDYLALWPKDDTIAPSKDVAKMLQDSGAKSLSKLDEAGRVKFGQLLAQAVEARKADKRKG